MDRTEARKRVRAEISEHLEAAVKHGPGYIDRYLESTFSSRYPPSTPTGMHPLLARFMRDVTWDVLTAERLDAVRVEVDV